MDTFENILNENLRELNEGRRFEDLDLKDLPSLQFGLETALLDFKTGGKRRLFDSSFTSGEPIAINGLIWIAGLEAMLEEADKKIKEGFTCIKFKIGAHDFDAECRMLELVRKKYSAFALDIRLDANGAFRPDEATEKLQLLSRFEIHSIEQPIGAGQLDWMQEICAKSKIRVALDEELIDVDVSTEGSNLLKMVKPAYLILKPTLIGGFAKADQWIALARKYQTGWWATSALESNIGLNAIAQWCATKNNTLPQGLGTGGLYTNNITSPLMVKHGKLIYIAENKWGPPL